MAAYQYNPYPFSPNRGGPNNPEQDQVALFIDWDNLVISNYADRGSNRPDLEVLIRRAQQYGTVVIARAYAEWNITADRLEVYKAGIEPIYAPVFHADRDLAGQTSRGKSLADPVMVTDCIDFLHLLPQVGTYVLVTGDKDMVPVVRLARLRGRRVVVIGPDYVANVLQQVSDEFIPYRFLLAQVVADPYATYYQPQPGQPFYQAGQLPQGAFPPQVPGQPVPPPPPAQQQPAATDRRGRRISNRRGQPFATQQPLQPYSRVMAPPPGQAQVPPNYYNQPNQPQPGATYPQVPPTQTDPYSPPAAYGQPIQPQPGYPLPGQAQVPGQVSGGYTPPTGYATPQAPVQPVAAPPPPATNAASSPARPSYSPPQAPAHPTAYTQPQPVAAPIPQVMPVPVPPAPATIVPPEAATAAPAKNGGSDFNEVKEAIRTIIAQRAATGRSQMRARDLKEELLRRIPNFSERRYGFSKFKALLNAVEAAGILQIDQSGHILWVAAPGTPRMQFGAAGVLEESGTAVLETDLDEEAESEGEDEADSPAVQAELEALDGAEASNDPLAGVGPSTVEPEEATLAPEEDDALLAPTVRSLEERTTSLVEAPIGAHREKPTPAPAVRAQTPTGPRPALLEQPFYEDVIVLIDNLRGRNRWLGYELLLSNVRDYLSRQMPESEAKIQAGVILSKLLNDSIIKMAVEVHSRGARKMTVKVAHLQDDNAAVRYALENFKAQQAQAQAAQAVVEVEEPSAALTLPATYAEPATASDEEGTTTPPENVGAAPFIEAQPEQTAVQELLSGEATDAGTPTESQAEENSNASYSFSHFTRQARSQSDLTPDEVQAETSTQAEGQTEMRLDPPSDNANDSDIQAEMPVAESAAEAGDLGQEADTSLSQELPQPTPEQSDYPTDGQPQAELYAQDQGEINNSLTAQAVDVAVEPEAGLEPQTGEHVHGEPEHAPEGEQPLPAGGYSNPAQMDAPEQVGDQPTGQYEPQASDEGKQSAAETLTPVLELDSEEVEEVEEVEGEVETEGDGIAPKAIVRRPRRRRTPRAASSEAEAGAGNPSESMAQPYERRPRMHLSRRPNHRSRAK